MRILAVLTLAVLAACSGTHPTETETAPKTPVPVEVEQLAVETTPQTVALSGVVRARRQATIAAQVMGTVRPGHCAAAPCVHWGVRRGEDYVDPLQFVMDLRPSVLLPLDR